MTELAEVYDGVRRDVSDLVSKLSDDELAKSVPATPGWTIKDVVCHLTGDTAALIAGDFPTDFFGSFDAQPPVESLNAWTDRMVAERRDLPLADVLAEWEKNSASVTAMMRGEETMPDGVPFFGDRVLITDVAAHQQDIFGALGIERERDSAQVRVGLATYIGGIDLRLRAVGGPTLTFDMGDKHRTVGGDGPPTATVRAPRFELFRALSGRRGVGQVEALEWEGDPEPFIPYFYPYGTRTTDLTE